MSTETQVNPTRVVTGKVRLSYVTLFEPKSIRPGQKAKYSLSVIIPKSDKVTINKVKAAIEAAKEFGKDKLAVKGKIPANLKTPLRDGDIERPDDEAYANSYFMNVNSEKKPQVVDINGNAILDPLEVYSGCYGRVSINMYAFNMESKGIAAGLGNVQKLAEGEALGGNVSAAVDFSDEFDNDDDV
jgi:hypothetical protein